MTLGLKFVPHHHRIAAEAKSGARAGASTMKAIVLANLLFASLLTWQGAQADYDRAVQLLKEGKAAEAEAALRETLPRYPDQVTPPLWRLHGVAQAQQGRLVEAAESFGQACRLNPLLPDACYYLGRALYSVNQFQAAVEPLRKAVRVDMVKSRAEAALGEAYEALGETEAAEEYFRWAIARHDRAHERAVLAYARFLTRQGRTGESVQLLKETLREYPKSGEAHFQMARALLQLDRVPEAAPFGEKALALAPGNPQWALLLARIYRRMGKEQEALELERKAQGSSTVRD